MMEAPEIIRMNVDRYRLLLGGSLTDEQRASIEQLLADALRRLDRPGEANLA